MRIQILCDSCCDFTAAERLSPMFQKVPAVVTVGGQRFLDDGTFQQTALLPYLRKETAVKVTFPDERAYLDAMSKDADEIYVVTSSAANVGQYETASRARRMRLREYPEQKIHVFNTRAGSVGQVLAARRIRKMQRSGCEFRQIVESVERELLSDCLYLLPESTERLREQGLLTQKKQLLLPAAICGKTVEGGLVVVASAMTDKGAEKWLVRAVSRTSGEKTCILAHCGGLERARRIAQALCKSGRFTDCLLTETGAVTSATLGPGGVALAFSC